jgi:hypothetical protein
VAGEERHCADQILRGLRARDGLRGRNGGKLLVEACATGPRWARGGAGRFGQARRDGVDRNAEGAVLRGREQVMARWRVNFRSHPVAIVSALLATSAIRRARNADTGKALVSLSLFSGPESGRASIGEGFCADSALS